ELRECPLARVRAADLSVTWYQRIMRLGSITVQSADENRLPVTWKHIKRPHEIHERLLRAISSAQSGPSA
ncbi:MAG: PH domain-containing protein, partial [Phycisphaerae bacterium]|nr:PH domain-containing protein [Phycisphaerae bacterium]